MKTPTHGQVRSIKKTPKAAAHLKTNTFNIVFRENN